MCRFSCAPFVTTAAEIVDFEVTYAKQRSAEAFSSAAEENVLGRTMREAFPESVEAGRLERYAEIVESGSVGSRDVQYTRGPVSHGLRVSAVKVWRRRASVAQRTLTERIQCGRRTGNGSSRRRRPRDSPRKRSNRAKSEFLSRHEPRAANAARTPSLATPSCSSGHSRSGHRGTTQCTRAYSGESASSAWVDHIRCSTTRACEGRSC
jgi:hypothetical protein